MTSKIIHIGHRVLFDARNPALCGNTNTIPVSMAFYFHFLTKEAYCPQCVELLPALEYLARSRL